MTHARHLWHSLSPKMGVPTRNQPQSRQAKADTANQPTDNFFLAIHQNTPVIVAIVLPMNLLTGDKSL
jgi:hypothetical protein